MHVRQAPGKELSWVQVMQGSPHVVVFNPSSLEVGSSYSVELESYSSKSLTKQTLKTDLITVKVKEPEVPVHIAVPPANDSAGIWLFGSLVIPLLAGSLALI